MGAVAIEQGQAFLEENKKGPGVVVLPSGLQYEIIKEGTGKKPKATDQVRCTMKYIDRRYTVRQLYPTRRTGCIRRQPSNPGMGGSFAADAGRFQMETVYSVRTRLWRKRCQEK